MNAYAPKQKTTVSFMSKDKLWNFHTECSSIEEAETVYHKINSIVDGKPLAPAPAANLPPTTPQAAAPAAAPAPQTTAANATTPNFFGQQQQGATPQQNAPSSPVAPALPPQIPAQPQQQPAGTGGLEMELAINVADVFCKDAWQPQLAKTSTFEGWKQQVVDYLTKSFTTNAAHYVDHATSRPGAVQGHDQNIVEFVNNNAQYLVGMIQ